MPVTVMPATAITGPPTTVYHAHNSRTVTVPSVPQQYITYQRLFSRPRSAYYMTALADPTPNHDATTVVTVAPLSSVKPLRYSLPDLPTAD